MDEYAFFPVSCSKAVEEGKTIDEARDEWFQQFSYPVSSCATDNGSWRLYDLDRPEGETKMSLEDAQKYLDETTYERLYADQEGENDGESWIFVVKTFEGHYIHFVAQCDYTGFDCRGGGSLHVSKDAQKFFDFGLYDAARFLLKPLRNKVGNPI